MLDRLDDFVCEVCCEELCSEWCDVWREEADDEIIN